MGGGDREYLSSGFGGQARVSGPQYQLIPAQIKDDKDRRSTEEVPVEQDIELRFQQRIINDILHRLIDPDKLERLPEMRPSNEAHKIWSPYT